MKKVMVILVIIFLTVSISCQTLNNSAASISNTADAFGKEWKLIEVRIDNRSTNFNRRTITQEGFSDIFSLNIDGETVFGVGAPNRYSAPYTVSEQDGQIKVALVRSTMMAHIYPQENLRERDFLIYIQNIYKWELSGGGLVVSSKDEKGAEVVLVFGQ